MKSNWAEPTQSLGPTTHGTVKYPGAPAVGLGHVKGMLLSRPKRCHSMFRSCHSEYGMILKGAPVSTKQSKATGGPVFATNSTSTKARMDQTVIPRSVRYWTARTSKEMFGVDGPANDQWGKSCKGSSMRQMGKSLTLRPLTLAPSASTSSTT